MSAPSTAAAPRLLLDLRDVGAGTRTRIELEGSRASIGRRANCDWQLDAAGVSRLHASVRHLDGVYFLEDHNSTNGVLHNGAPLRPAFPAALRDGDRVQIDLFEIAVTLLPAEPGDQSDAGIGAPTTAAPPAPVSPSDASDDAFAAPALAPISAAVVNPLALFATSYTMTGVTPAHAAPDWNHSPALADGYRARQRAGTDAGGAAARTLGPYP